MIAANVLLLKHQSDISLDISSFNTEVRTIEEYREEAFRSGAKASIDLLEALPVSFQSLGQPDRTTGINTALEFYKAGVKRELIQRLNTFDLEELDANTAGRIRKFLSAEKDDGLQSQL